MSSWKRSQRWPRKRASSPRFLTIHSTKASRLARAGEAFQSYGTGTSARAGGGAKAALATAATLARNCRLSIGICSPKEARKEAAQSSRESVQFCPRSSVFNDLSVKNVPIEGPTRRCGGNNLVLFIFFPPGDVLRRG